MSRRHEHTACRWALTCTNAGMFSSFHSSEYEYAFSPFSPFSSFLSFLSFSSIYACRGRWAAECWKWRALGEAAGQGDAGESRHAYARYRARLLGKAARERTVPPSTASEKRCRTFWRFAFPFSFWLMVTSNRAFCGRKGPERAASIPRPSVTFFFTRGRLPLTPKRFVAGEPLRWGCAVHALSH